MIHELQNVRSIEVYGYAKLRFLIFCVFWFTYSKVYGLNFLYASTIRRRGGAIAVDPHLRSHKSRNRRRTQKDERNTAGCRIDIEGKQGEAKWEEAARRRFKVEISRAIVRFAGRRNRRVRGI